MEVTVHGKHSRIPAATQRFAIEKLSHLARFLPTITSIDIELYEDGKKSRTGRSHVADVAVRTSGPVFRSRAVAATYRGSVDLAYERLERRVKEFKRRRSGKPPHLNQERPGHLNSRLESADKRQRA